MPVNFLYSFVFPFFLQIISFILKHDYDPLNTSCSLSSPLTDNPNSLIQSIIYWFFFVCFCADFVISLSSLILKNGLILLSFPPVCISQRIISHLFLFSGLVFCAKYKEGFSSPVLFNVDFMWFSFIWWLLLSWGVRILSCSIQNKAIGMLRVKC